MLVVREHFSNYFHSNLKISFEAGGRWAPLQGKTIADSFSIDQNSKTTNNSRAIKVRKMDSFQSTLFLILKSGELPHHTYAERLLGG